jgi:benzoylformate decarboxylase
MPTVHQATWGLLRALGVRKVFGNPGSTEMPFGGRHGRRLRPADQ